MCYSCGMGEVGSRELRNDTRGLLRRVEAGEQVVITVDGRPVAVLAPVPGRPRWMTRDDFIRRFASRQADAALASELRHLVPDLTDDQLL
jgi:prevent-host-death family protein